MSKVKFQHYVPRFYLEKFCNADGRVWVYDKKLDKAYCTKPESVGGEKYFYDIPRLEAEIGIPQVIEKFFGPFETAAAAILSKWLQKLEAGTYFRIYREEKAVFSMFLATQLVRVPNHRNLIMQLGAMLRKIEVQASLSACHPHLDFPEFDIRWNKQAEPYFHAESIVDEESLSRCAWLLNSHIWAVTRNVDGNTLYTSDNPVVRRPHKTGGWRSHSGLGSEGIQLIFPLSPKFSLSILERTYWRKFEKGDGKLDARGLRTENVEHDNSLQVQQSTRFLFCQRNDFTLARRFCVEFPHAADPERPLIEGPEL